MKVWWIETEELRGMLHVLKKDIVPKGTKPRDYPSMSAVARYTKKRGLRIHIMGKSRFVGNNLNRILFVQKIDERTGKNESSLTGTLNLEDISFDSMADVIEGITAIVFNNRNKSVRYGRDPYEDSARIALNEKEKIWSKQPHIRQKTATR